MEVYRMSESHAGSRTGGLFAGGTGRAGLVLTAVILFLVSLFLRTYRLFSAPDIFGDEALYTAVANSILKSGVPICFNGPCLVHPPLFFYVQAAFLWLVGAENVNLQTVFLARVPTAIFGSLAVALVCLWMTKITNLKVGVISAIVVMLEPYTLKFDRTGILEALVLLFIISSLFFLWRGNDSGRMRDYGLAGLFFGLAIFTKELALFMTVCVLIYWFLTKYYLKVSVETKNLMVFFGVGLPWYVAYLVWGWWLGASTLLANERYMLGRVLWLITDTGYTQPGHIPFLADFMAALPFYAATYVLVALSVPTCGFLLFREKSRTSLLLASWLLGSGVFFAVIGIHNPQFIIYIVTPAILVDCYALSKMPITSTAAFPSLGQGIDARKLSRYVLALGLIMLALYNTGVWVHFYANGTDSAFAQAVTWIQVNLPAGTKIDANYIYAYFLPSYNVTDLRLYNSICGQGIHYYIISDRLIVTLDPKLYEYVIANGQVVAHFQGFSMLQVYIYYLSDPP